MQNAQKIPRLPENVRKTEVYTLSQSKLQPHLPDIPSIGSAAEINSYAAQYAIRRIGSGN